MHLSRQALAFLLFNIAVCNEAAEASPEAPVVEEEAAVVYEFKVLSRLALLSALSPRCILSVSWTAQSIILIDVSIGICTLHSKRLRVANLVTRHQPTSSGNRNQSSFSRAIC